MSIAYKLFQANSELAITAELFSLYSTNYVPSLDDKRIADELAQIAHEWGNTSQDFSSTFEILNRLPTYSHLMSEIAEIIEYDGYNVENLIKDFSDYFGGDTRLERIHEVYTRLFIAETLTWFLQDLKDEQVIA